MARVFNVSVPEDFLKYYLKLQSLAGTGRFSKLVTEAVIEKIERIEGNITSKEGIDFEELKHEMIKSDPDKFEYIDKTIRQLNNIFNMAKEKRT